MRVVFACDIPASVIIGERTILAHNGLGVVIHENVVIGDDCKILQNVTIGGRGTDKVPVIKNNCLIGAGACILGDVLIGDNCKIGANAVVITNIPSNSIAVGVPAKIISSQN